MAPIISWAGRQATNFRVLAGICAALLYFGYQTNADLLAPLLNAARLGQASLSWVNGKTEHAAFRRIAASLELVSRFQLTHERPAYGVTRVKAGNQDVAVFEEAALKTPFGTLLHFRKEMEACGPKVLVVAPLSGHFATLLRNTVETLLADHDVYITDWTNARDVPLSAGPFGFDDYLDHVMDFLRAIGPRTHVVAVCQPCVQTLAAAAVMAEQNDPAQPLSMTLMGGPVDVRINPTKVNNLANERSMDWFEKNMITEVPWRFAGAGRRVYPGFVQLNAFMQMNMERHVGAHKTLYEHLAAGEIEKAETIKKFYDEYFAVLDLAAEFYLDTVRIVFQDALLAKGGLTYRGAPVRPEKIKRTALLTVEGERDDVCALGQTAAAHDLCSSLRPYLKKHHMQTSVGHYGLFSGKRWETQIYPIVRNMILTLEA
jgi:poly(3-hydroxybutyrate) depolymerase